MNTIIYVSYGGHYCRFLPHILDNLRFRSNRAARRPIIDALDILKQFRDSRLQYFPEEVAVPRDGVVASKWSDLALEKDKHGVERISRLSPPAMPLPGAKARPPAARFRKYSALGTRT